MKLSIKDFLCKCNQICSFLPFIEEILNGNFIFCAVKLCEPLTAESSTVYPRGYNAQKITLIWRKLNELAENVSLDTKLVLIFELDCLKLRFSVFFLNVNFSKYYRAEWVTMLLKLNHCTKDSLGNAYSKNAEKLVYFQCIYKGCIGNKWV